MTFRNYTLTLPPRGASFLTRRTAAAAFFSIAAGFILTASARADVIQTLGSYDSPNGYDFATTFPPSGSTTIGTYTFTIPAGDTITGITISGSFGNGDSATTALSDYYLGDAADGETAVEVAACDNVSDNCYSGQEGPYSWTATLTDAEIADLSTGLADGSLDFTYTWGTSPAIEDFFSPTGYDDQYVYAGPATIDISYTTPTPEPATFLFCLTGIAGMIGLRRLRKA